MTRRPQVTGSRRGSGGVQSTTLIAPALALVGLLVVSMLTIDLLNGEIPLSGGNRPGSTDRPAGPERTAAPSNVVIPEPEAVFLGSIVYAKSGNIWIQTDTDARQLTSSGNDSMPSWSPDGEWIYYIESVPGEGPWPVDGSSREYVLETPHLKRVRPDGASPPEDIKDGEVRSGRNRWFYWMRQPVVSPDGTTVAMVTDAPNPNESDVVLQLLDLETNRFTRVDVPQVPPLGHQDPAWRPDGRYLLYVRNGRDGPRGVPVIYRYDMEEERTRAMTAPGYLHPAYSPDGRYIAATKTSSYSTDVVILDGGRGTELLRVTTDGRSWAPVWSPAGDAIAFLHIDGLSVDLRMATLSGGGPDWTLEEIVDLTDVSGLHAASRPSWFIPPDQLPATPPPTPAPSLAPPASSAP